MTFENTDFSSQLTAGATRAKEKVARVAFFWLSAFFVVYCARPEDWLPGVGYFPLAKITAIFALWGLYRVGGLKARVLRNLPIESTFLLALIALLYTSAVLSPIWKGGAVVHTIDFSKCYIVWLLTFLLVTDFTKFRRIVFIQAASVAVIALVSVIKGHNQPRLEGVLGGIYGNPNDLAFAIVLCLPFCLAFLLTARGLFRKSLWMCGMLIMGVALLLTASRAGFIDLVFAGSVCLWHFSIRGKRLYLIVVTALVGVLLMMVAGKQLEKRLIATTGDTQDVQDERAYGSMEARKYLMERAIQGIEQYPLLGLGINNFLSYSGDWHEVHMSYLQIAVEGGVFSLLLYLLFFSRGFINLRKIRQFDLDEQTTLFVGALHSSLVGFVVGALFAPEAYQFFPYFTVGYTSALLAIMQRGGAPAPEPRRSKLSSMARLQREIYAGS